MKAKSGWGASRCVLMMAALCGLLACGDNEKHDTTRPGDGAETEAPGTTPGSPGHDPDDPSDDEELAEREPWIPPPDASFGARLKAPPVDIPTRPVGKACSSWGASDCKGGVCLQVSPLPNPLEVCTQACAAPAD